MANLQFNGKIADLDFHGWTGRLIPIMAEAENFQRLGQFGTGSQIVGYKAPDSVINTWRGFTSKEEAQSFIVQAENLQNAGGVAANDPYGDRYSNCRIKRVTPEPIRKGRGTTVNGSAQMTHLVRIEFVIEVLPAS